MNRAERRRLAHHSPAAVVENVETFVVRHLARMLDAEGIRYLLCGGCAALVHGVSAKGEAKDIDFWVQNGTERAALIAMVPRVPDYPFPTERGGGLQIDVVTDHENSFAAATQRLHAWGNDIAGGITLAECWERRLEVGLLGGVRLAVIGRADLIANKRAIGRPHDHLVADELERLPPRKAQTSPQTHLFRARNMGHNPRRVVVGPGGVTRTYPGW